MAFRKILILFLPLFFLSCAQIGVLSGGEEDTHAPKPLVDEISPKNESVNFTAKQIEIPFNEFISLNNPAQNIQIVPNHTTLKTEIKRKSLYLSWEDDLMANTTYVIYMNGAVKDVTEGNDSLMTYVFSTGPVIDTISIHARVVDIQNNQILKNVQVGLFAHPDSLKPYYYSKTNAEGIATFSYVKSGNYYLRAFQDANNDLTVQKSEKMGFIDEVLSISESRNDTIALFISEQLLEPKIRNFIYQNPGKFILSANDNLKNCNLSVNGKILDNSEKHYYDNDSLWFVYPLKELAELSIIISSEGWADSESIRISEKEKLAPLNINSSSTQLNVGPHELVQFEVNGVINSIDNSLIKVANVKDTLEIIEFTSEYKNGFVILDIKNKNLSNVKVNFLKGSLKGEFSEIKTDFKAQVQLLTGKDYGSISLNLKTFEGSKIIEVIQDKKLIRTVLTEEKIIKIDHLLPGEYSFRVIEDTNKNGMWDGVSFEKKLQAELIRTYSKPTKVRANWEVELQLEK